MSTLRLFQNRTQQVHPTAAWYLSDLGEFRGKQVLYTRQSPQRLKALREHAIIESAVSLNRIEGVSVDPARVQDILVAVKAPRGAKTDQVLAAIRKFVGDFTVAQLEHHCPGVSRDMIRRVLREQQAEGAVECKGRGPAAKWRKKG